MTRQPTPAETPAAKAAIAINYMVTDGIGWNEAVSMRAVEDIIQAAIDETAKEVYSRAGYGPKPPEDAR